jgi:hypothetical protein
MPESVAQPADVVARWRPLNARQQRVAATKLADVERRIRKRMAAAGRDFDTEVADLAGDFRADVIEIEAEAVARVLRNPDGLRSEGLENYQSTRDKSLSDGQLKVTADEWKQIGLGPGSNGKAYTIDMTPDIAYSYGDTWVYR